MLTFCFPTSGLSAFNLTVTSGGPLGFFLFPCKWQNKALVWLFIAVRHRPGISRGSSLMSLSELRAVHPAGGPGERRAWKRRAVRGNKENLLEWKVVIRRKGQKGGRTTRLERSVNVNKRQQLQLFTWRCGFHLLFISVCSSRIMHKGLQCLHATALRPCSLIHLRIYNLT